MTAFKFLAALAAFGLRVASAVPHNLSSVTFDYIVVGAGSAGLTVASRLSEDPSVSVAIVEAGTWSELVTGNQSQIPGHDFYYNGKSPSDTNPKVEWGFVTTPQAGVNGQSIHYSRGKSLGGCTNLNYMGYTQATEGSLQLWADTVGDASYAYNASSYYYRKSLNFTPANTQLRLANATTEAPNSISTGGPLHITFPSWAQSFSTWISIAMNAMGIRSTEPFTNGHLNGSSWVALTIDPTTGHRASAATTFLARAANRLNLHIFDLSLAERILFDPHRVARAVKITSLTNTTQPTNITTTLHARREIILSAGAFQSPQLLLVSGVGPASLLKQHNIPLVADRPGVGQNMSDHPFFGIAYRVNVETSSALQYGDANALATAEFNANGTGPLASPGGDFAGYEKLPAPLRTSFSNTTRADLSRLPSDWPEVQYLTLPDFVGDFESRTASAPTDGYQYATLLATLIAPSSRGNVSISSSRMSDPPLINPNWLTTEQDVEMVVAAFKRLRQILEAPVMKNVTIGEEYYPGSEVSTDEEIFAQIQKSFNTMYHASTSCRMGRKEDPWAVVDNRARVFGVEGLRVVDASAFPFLPPGLPQATIYMLAEKIADDIKKGR
ncbi:putative choline dehydrogenase [Aspergillus sclerotioniger CBS 115572]|uniref:Putative choline dehydrogenase n=1 Tax=Aspergillus sclerotioniger CBS 115572 TaxID=1450535 RepID=A0A317WMT4_9EURO|nr:putative choline dehydrogenase [Aspergillus sclerotioniger CBS 115572]PWY86592.1 putative choline dehydrogenase [Aspergillus sclerotioniger CBS 115572]